MNENLAEEFEQSMVEIGCDKQPDGSCIHCCDGDIVSAGQALLEQSGFMALRLALIRDGVVSSNL